MNDPAAIIDVSGWAPIRIEQMGSKAKDWRTDPHDVHRVPWLFKSPRANTGEHWAEVAAAGAASLIGVPHAPVALATTDTGDGVICRSLIWSAEHNLSLVHGNELLRALDQSYPQVVEGFTPVPEHTPGRVLDALNSGLIGPPPGSPNDPRLTQAADHFVGYLMFDAWIGNTDRHHENWALILATEPKTRFVLSPSYDHGSSLSRELTDDRRREHLDAPSSHRGIDKYCRKCPSRFYDSAGKRKKPLTPLQAFQEAAAQRPQAAACWLERLEAVDTQSVAEMLNAVPGAAFSPTARRFASAMMNIQQAELLHLLRP